MIKNIGVVVGLALTLFTGCENKGEKMAIAALEQLGAKVEFEPYLSVNLGGTKITDAGLAHLEGMTGLEYLFFEDTQITETAREKIKAELPGCFVMDRR